MPRHSCPRRPDQGRIFFYYPTIQDRIFPQTDLQPWEMVRTTYGETFQPTDCYVERVVGGKWTLAGIVAIASLNTKEQRDKYKDVDVSALQEDQGVYLSGRAA